MKKFYTYLSMSIFLFTQSISTHFESRPIGPITTLLVLRIAQLATTSYQTRNQPTRTSLQPFPHPHHTSPAITERVVPTTTEPMTPTMKRYKYL